MLARWCRAAIHLLAFGFAFASVFGRARALRQLDPASSLSANSARLKHVFRTDGMWGIAALVLLITGAMRAFGGFEKGSAYYLHEPLFHLKITAFILILLIEITPMIALIRWRSALARGGAINLGKARKICSDERRRGRFDDRDGDCRDGNGSGDLGGLNRASWLKYAKKKALKRMLEGLFATCNPS